MSDVTELKCWPSCLGAIDWCQDGIIALASEDQVELLFPNTESYDSDREVGAQWRHFPLQVPWFTKEELPVRDSAPLKVYSVGEEISTSHSVALAWSPSGLAKHRRCALAVLTANLVLSIWATEGKPNDATSWDRRLIVNTELENYFANKANEDEGYVADSNEEKLRLRRRVRAFAWAPAMSDAQATSIVGTRIPWGQNVVAVSNDDNHVILLAIDSPTSTLGVDDDWSCKTLGRFSLISDARNVDTKKHTFDEIMDQQRHASHIAWSPWTSSRDGLQSVLAYATNDDVRARLIFYCKDKITFGAEITYEKIELRYAGPMSWSPQVAENGTLTLAFFSTTKIICLTISATDASIRSRVSHHLDGRRDAISGVAWDVQAKDTTRVHFSSQTTTTRCSTAALQLSSIGLSDVSIPGWPYWREQISGRQAHYSAHHELKGHANARVWGLSTSPLGDFIASCTTVHPTDMIEYGTNNDRRTAIAITNLWGRGNDLIFPAKNVSAEGIFSTVRKWIDNNVESADDEMPMVKEDIHNRLTKEYIPVQNSSTTVMAYTSTNLDVLLDAFKQNAFLDVNTLRDRYEILTSYICTPTETTELPRILIAFRLAKELAKLPSILCESNEFSRSILESGRNVMRLVEDLISTPDVDADADAEGEDDDDPDNLPRPSATISVLDNNEACIFCDANIPFMDIASAACLKGHEFMRCGLSFLAIQAPRCTKWCGICNTPFLSDDYVLSEHGFGSSSPSRSPSPQNEVEASSSGTVMLDADRSGGDDGHEARSAPAPATTVSSSTTVQEGNMQIGQTIDGSAAMYDTAGQSVVDEMDVDASNSRADEELHEDNPAVTATRQGPRVTSGKTRAKDIPVTLARVLFLACDVCIYCGGKFVG